MDRVKLGRALGYGTRHAARTIVAVAQAATASDPQSAQGTESPQAQYSAARPGEAQRPKRTRLPASPAVRQAGRSFWAPLATFSGALWLRVTGLFFGLISLAMANGAWRLHTAAASLGRGLVTERRFWLFAVFALLFGYFAVSSFVRASLRERRAGATTPRR